MEEKHVLVVFPHPDDESFGAGGTIAQFTKAGVPVTYACLTLGEMGRNMGKPPFATRESIPNLRKKELKDACEVLGIKDLRLLGYRDKTVEFEEEEKIVNEIKALINELNPSLIITHYPEHGVHPDHDATGRATVEAVRQLAKGKRPKLYCIAITKNRETVLGNPDIVNDVEDTMSIKVEAIRAHRSQTEAMFQKPIDENNRIKKWLKEEIFWLYQFQSI
ncbi:bacillithiol biosynthesis deacetylase BshB2 [Anaerobacillus arseniciselenatis]|uniref:Bacillithiol biosynthesis deacetylase BshB2 n=1 Tax=Anaerobacillus arseniciselenatis TaxID=85682 RepID=A0A1S2LU44_9BACI|nr:bacillithiol biosynthesis deacetylase BshB2 [Anaerobacillus arseniciselenatis]OIJ15730.1 bacillithiol biosynthesis deacetylase BshB2 [Anaerobacillus arseniciselenatis]